jgi:hypothetical protein
MDFEHASPGKEAEGNLADIGIQEADVMQDSEIFNANEIRFEASFVRREPVQSLEGAGAMEIHSRVMELGKLEAKAGEEILARMKPRWLACVLATMCAIEEHGRFGTHSQVVLTEESGMVREA